jgi:hypothetical protein
MWLKNSTVWRVRAIDMFLWETAVFRTIIFEKNWLITLQQGGKGVGGAEHCVALQGKMVH